LYPWTIIGAVCDITYMWAIKFLPGNVASCIEGDGDFNWRFIHEVRVRRAIILKSKFVLTVAIAY